MTDISVVIPSIKEDVLTLESVPEECDTNVVRDGTLNEARNEGVRQAEFDRIIILDDDISFTEEFFWELADRIRPRVLVGYPDWDYGFVAGRVMAFNRNDWMELGGFDELLQSHMGDTEFALKFVHQGEGTEQIDANEITHKPHERSVTARDRIWRTAYLSLKYPKSAPHIVWQTLI